MPLQSRVAGRLLMGTLLIGVLLYTLPIHVHAQMRPEWRDSGLIVPPESRNLICFDTAQPHVFLRAETSGTVAYNWATGQRRVLSSYQFSHCGPQGWVYRFDYETNYAYRLSLSDPQERRIDRLPTHAAQDGSLRVYSLNWSSYDNSRSLWTSDDGGVTWQERAPQWAGRITGLVVSRVDAQTIYVQVAELNSEGRLDEYAPSTIFFSSDAGVTWDERDHVNASVQLYSLAQVPGYSRVNDVASLTTTFGSAGGSSGVRISSDGGQTFINVALSYRSQSQQVVATPDGLLRLTWVEANPMLRFEQSADGGRTWQAQPLPALPSTADEFSSIPILTVADVAPWNVFLRSDNILWHSPDGGHTWHLYQDRTGGYFWTVTPYLPFTILGFLDNYVYTLELPAAGSAATVPVSPVGAGEFFVTTGHNVSPLFTRFWHANGGLAQWGYPRTEPFHEINPSDGKVYLVQYFERNRFEYHPELSNTPYEILLGLLGTQLTVGRKQSGEVPFQRVSDPKDPNTIFFATTGHTLSGSFRRYWEANGGLALYGYPLSEPFQERNPDDGRTYLVQYFERTRFEYHPEHEGTAYEVLLGLLGNAVLRDKGW